MIKRFTFVLSLLTLAVLLISPALGAPTARAAKARLNSATAMRGNAQFEVRPRANAPVERRFDVNVSRGAPLKALPVRVNGKRVGTVVTNLLGNGKLNLRSTGTGASKMPKSFPSVKAGDLVTVGNCSGVWSDDCINNDCNDDDCSDDDCSADDSSDDDSSDDDTNDDSSDDNSSDDDSGSDDDDSSDS